MNLVSLFDSVRDNWNQGIACDTSLISKNGAKVEINFVMLHLKNSWLKEFYINENENVLIFPDHSYEEIYQFAKQLYHHGDIEVNKVTRVVSVSQPKLVYARKSKPSEVVTEVVYARKSKPPEFEIINDAQEAGFREGVNKRKFSCTAEAISDENDNDHDDEIVAKRPRIPSMSYNDNQDTSNKPSPVCARTTLPAEIIIETSHLGECVT